MLTPSSCRICKLCVDAARRSVLSSGLVPRKMKTDGRWFKRWYGAAAAEAKPTPRRAVLYVPGNSEKMLNKLTNMKVDCAVMECEDGVAINRKAEARQTVRCMLDSLELPKVSDVAVRVNSMESGFAEEDLDVILQATRLPDTILVPKVDSVKHIQWLVRQLNTALRDHQPTSRIKIIIYAESAQGVLRLSDIIEEAQRLFDPEPFHLDGVVFGSDDYCADIGATRSYDAAELMYARQKVVLVAKAYGLQAIDMVHIDVKDQEALKKFSEEGARMGFTGKQVIHPSQVPIVQQAFSPSAERIEWARELLAGFEQHQLTGKGAFIFRGSMIDMPLVLQARNIIQLAAVDSES